MPYDRFIKTNRIISYLAKPAEIKLLFQLATRDLKIAARNLEDAPGWAYNIAYKSIHQASYREENEK